MASRIWARLLISITATPYLVLKKYRVPPKRIKRILIVNHLLLGDTIMLTPLIKKLRLIHPNAQIFMALPEAYACLYEKSPYKLHTIGFNPRKPTSILSILVKMRNFDVAYVPGDNLWSWLALAMNSKWIVAFEDKENWKNKPINEFVKFPSTLMTWGDISTTLVSKKYITPTYSQNDWSSPSYKKYNKPFCKYAVLHLGASKPHKYWDSNNWNQLASWIRSRNIKVVWSTGKDEVSLLNNIHCKNNDYIYRGDLDLSQLYNLLENAQFLICPDTGIAHLGRVTNTPTITIFGPGSPLISGAGYFWKDSNFFPIWKSNVECRNQKTLFEREIEWVKQCWRSERQCKKPFCSNLIKVQDIIPILYKIIKE